MQWTANITTGWIVTIITILAAIRISLWRVQTVKGSSATIKWFTEFCESALIAIILVFGLIRPFVIQAFFIPSGSMRPTLIEQDRIIVNKFVYRFTEPHRGDIIVFKAPRKALFGGDPAEKDYIKRVIGLPGDTVEVKDDHLVYINDKPLTNESYELEQPAYTLSKIKIPEGQYFVMGDNRNDSNDSHVWGTLDGKRILGKAMITFWPVDRIRLLK